MFLVFNLLCLYQSVLLCTADRPQSEETENYFSIGAHLNADSFSRTLRRNVYQNLRIGEFRDILSSVRTSNITYDDRVLSNIASKLDLSFSDVSSLLPSLVSLNSSKLPPACNSIHEVIRLRERQPCCIFHKQTTTDTESLGMNIATNPVVQRQFLYSDGVQLESPAEFLSTHSKLHWTPVLSQRRPHRRKIVLIVDMGFVSSVSQLDSVKTVVLHLLDLALPSDEYAVLVLAENDVIHTSQCDGSVFENIEQHSFSRLRRMIRSLELSIPIPVSNHSFSLTRAFQLLTTDSSEIDSLILQYISRGVISELSDASDVLRTLAQLVLNHNVPVKINTIVPGDENHSPLHWTTEFMRSLAAQNFSPYKQTLGDVIEKLDANGYVPIRGEMVMLNESVTSALDLDTMKKILSDPRIILSRNESSPKWIFRTEEYDDSVTATVSQTELLGENAVVVGMDVSLKEIWKSVTSDNLVQLAPPTLKLQLFLVNMKGSVLLSLDNGPRGQLSEIEGWSRASNWLLPYLSEGSGEKGDFEVRNENGETLNYHWVKLKSAPLIVVQRTVDDLPQSITVLEEYPRQLFSMNHMMWHASHTKSNCDGNHPKSAGAAFLAETAFRSTSKSKQSGKNIWVFLSDNIGLIRSDALHYGVREEMGILAQLVRKWIEFRKTTEDGSVIRRFAATRRGSMVVFPPALVKDGYNPANQKWFAEAVSAPGSIVITGPRLDADIGDVVTISTTVSYPNSLGVQVFAVVGMEVPSVYLHSLLFEGIPSCGQSRRCILFTPDGSLIYADDQTDRGRKSSEVVERFHLSHLEPLLMSQMTENSRLVRKTKCQSGTTVRRHFQWNMTYTRVHTTACDSQSPRVGGSIHNEVLRVPFTQIFIAMVNTTCRRTAITAFCPCSVHDERCLFCGRFDTSQCECPCNCPASTCNSGKDDDRILPCPAELHADSLTETPFENCMQTDCTTLLHPSSCWSSLGCEWCRFNEYGKRVGFGSCAPVSQCYQGVKGRTTTKSDRTVSTADWTNGTPLGPLTAAVMTVFLVFVVVFYCYRNQLTRILSRRALSESAPLFQLDGKHFEIDGVFREEKVSVQLASFERQVAPPIRPSAAVSDHGYSTMTDRNTAEDETESAASTVTEGPRMVSLKMNTDTTTVITSVDVHAEPSLALIT